MWMLPGLARATQPYKVRVACVWQARVRFPPPLPASTASFTPINPASAAKLGIAGQRQHCEQESSRTVRVGNSATFVDVAECGIWKLQTYEMA